MTTEMITLKLEDAFLEDIDAFVEKEAYQNRTEFIRSALREKLENARLREAIVGLSHLKGAAKKHVSEEEYEKIRELI